MSQPKPSLRGSLDAGAFVVAPGVPDLIAATIANKVGFDFVFHSGYWSSAAIYGLPDAGLTTYSQMVERVRMLAQTSNASVIADSYAIEKALTNLKSTGTSISPDVPMFSFPEFSDLIGFPEIYRLEKNGAGSKKNSHIHLLKALLICDSIKNAIWQISIVPNCFLWRPFAQPQNGHVF